MEKVNDYKKRFKKAKETEKASKLFTRYKLTKMGYHYVGLESRKGFESKGIVDAIAVKKVFGEGVDSIEIVLLQIKGNAKVPEKELQRLKEAKMKVMIKYGTAEYEKGRLAEIKVFDD